VSLATLFHFYRSVSGASFDSYMKGIHDTDTGYVCYRIYALRTTLAAFYSFRIDSLETRLKGFQTERTKTIQKLKAATKYDSTLELIQKYGGTEAKPSKKKDGDGDAAGSKKGPQGLGGHDKERTPGRTNMAPPPTANILRRDGPISGPGTPQQHQTSTQLHPYGQGPGLSPQGPSPSPSRPVSVSEEFAPNAFGSAPPAQQMAGQYEGAPASHWYDRVLDLLLGEDETAPKNRIVLICKECRLVNGQAPPGTKSLAELGLWKCMACGTSNGEMDEGKKIVREVLEARQQESGVKRAPTSTGSEAGLPADSRDTDSSDVVDVGKEEEVDEEEKEEKEEKPTKLRRRRGKGKI